MRVLIAHNHYAQFGGEDVAFEQEVGLLRDHDHAVRVIVRDNRDIRAASPGARARLFAGTIWSRPSYLAVRDAIREFRPDVLHVHNFLPLLSPSVYHAAWAEDVPVVQTLHNYRLICPVATLYRDGRTCGDCVGRSPWPGVVHACYRGSRAASLAVASMLAIHRRLGTWQRVEAYVAVSDFVRRTLVGGGLPAERVEVKPNFVAGDSPVRDGPGDYALYVGRLAREKGLHTLVEAWSGPDGRPPMRLPLTIVGAGPLEGELRRLVGTSGAPVEMIGARPRGDVMKLLANARFLVCPSEWHEPLPFVALEALAVGVPVVASRLGGFADLIRDEETGLHFAPGDAVDLWRAARRLADDLASNARMGRAAREEYLARYTPAQGHRQLLDIYRRAQARRAHPSA